MYQFLTQKGQLLAFGLGIIIAVIFLIGIFNGLEEFNMLDKDAQKESNIFNFGLYASVALIILCFIAWFVFSILHIADNPRASVQGLIGVAVLLVIFFILYSMAKPDTGSVLQTVQDFDVSETASNIITAAIGTTGVLMAGAILAFVGFEIRNLFK